MTRDGDDRRWDIADDRLCLADLVNISFQRTRQVESAAVPPQSYGALPVRRVGDGADSYAVVPLRSTEAFWIGLEPAREGAVCAVRICIEEPVVLDALTGREWQEALGDSPQNYCVVPDQTSVDGVQVASTEATQFVLHSTSGAVECSKLRLIAVPAHFASASIAAEAHRRRIERLHAPAPRHPTEQRASSPGRVPQHLAPDPFGLAYWDSSRARDAPIAIVAPEAYEGLTGQRAPRRLDRRRTYRGWRLP